MRVLIEYTQTGKYRDHAWEALTIRSKGEVQAVTPSYAAQLIEQDRASLSTTENQDIVIQP
ncbi:MULTISPECIES: hypothetical protein [Vibrio]|uniref:C factor cell-cell signaling protein n=1 Tax=Vibrio tasmaniensis TaxID=212663 RepID=A0A2N7NLL5_9VIBR|nr:hypothetical protein [Vibrio tasmaniensis]PMP16658.1 hypothetical protein BCS92_08430 [Vibrio tasmaniensis]TKG37803.1 hypothetical protein FC057_00770 [Vibrio tasmaniensis]TKG43242.1 hypothetical protein FC060_19990 [Vibrio tasmaniensis]TKG43965.1 hypothetical protein FC063_00770 [Vibrio tasmaniensis]TKG47515.1 hypothetical protein FC061_16180 [Vibrio tasmaniensis]